MSMLTKWFTERRFCRTSTSDAESPISVATPETIEKIRDIVLV